MKKFLRRLFNVSLVDTGNEKSRPDIIVRGDNHDIFIDVKIKKELFEKATRDANSEQKEVVEKFSRRFKYSQ